jgi:tyrosine-specific transport protein
MLEVDLQESKSNNLGIFNSSLLIAGTCIGGGMLALPLTVGSYGFFPSLAIMFLCCVFMSITALLYMEATLWMEKGAHMSTLSSILLNRFWRAVCFFIYLFICYASIVAYLSAAGEEITHALKENMGYVISQNEGMYLFSAIFGGILILGHRILGRVNTLLFTGMILAYLLLIYSGTKSIDLENVTRSRWHSSLFFASPILLASFSFPGIVPSITRQLKKNTKHIVTSILIGTTITFLFYAVWLFLIFGVVNYEGDFGLKQAYICDTPATQCLYHIVNNPLVSSSAQYFGFFALATSFLGISLSLFDFFCDTFSVKTESVKKNITLTLFVLLPSILLAIKFNLVFLAALEISGGVGDAFLSGMIPVLMVWSGRYTHNYQGNYTVFGGRILLVLVFIISFAIFIGNIVMLAYPAYQYVGIE